MEIYRVKLFTHDKKTQSYCVTHNRLAVGWSNGYETNDIYEYMSFFNKKIVNKSISTRSGEYRSINNIYENIKENDLVWTKIDGRTYLLGLVKSPVRLNSEEEVYDNDIDIGLERDCEWKEINFDDVPGQIVSQFVGFGATLSHVNCNDANGDELKNYCMWLYDDKNNGTIIIKNYKYLLHSEDLEDLLGLYLQDKRGYYIIPSTNKSSTKYIEYELRNKNGEKACIQCKIGNAEVSSEIFEEFNNYNKIFISTCSDKNYNNCGKNVETIEMQVLCNWAERNQNLLPERIKNYINLCK